LGLSRFAYRSLFPPPRRGVFARRWRAADGDTCRRRPVAEESPLSGKHGVGREPDGRESELRSRHDTARRDGDGAASEAPPGYDETAASPGASSERRGEVFPGPSRRARSRMLPEPERGLLPRPGRLVRKLAGRRPKNASFWAGNPLPSRPGLTGGGLPPGLFPPDKSGRLHLSSATAGEKQRISSGTYEDVACNRKVRQKRNRLRPLRQAAAVEVDGQGWPQRSRQSQSRSRSWP